jgi:hypothetical protein
MPILEPTETSYSISEWFERAIELWIEAGQNENDEKGQPIPLFIAIHPAMWNAMVEDGEFVKRMTPPGITVYFPILGQYMGEFRHDGEEVSIYTTL